MHTKPLAPVEHDDLVLDERPTARAASAPLKFVQVELVWPESRGAKIDCKGNTGIVWSSTGDVQPYPADKWHLLANNPDVWRLVDPGDETTARRARATSDAIETPEHRVDRVNLEHRVAMAAKLEADERDRLAAIAAKVRGAQTNTDVVVLKDPPDPLSAEEAGNRQAAYKLVTQDMPAIEAALLAKDEANAAGALAAGIPPEKPVGIGTHVAHKRVSGKLTEDQLAEMSDADVHAEGLKRDFSLHPRLNPVNLRARFLELQAAKG
jgi:hypothetical protein